jgi:hypothetical protein
MNSQNQADIPETQNLEWGFWGELNEHAVAGWPIAMTAITEATGCDLDATRAFLDSRYGRHFADSVLNYLSKGHPLQTAIKAATQEWMGWKIGGVTAKEYGIPRGLPYLTGFVIHCGIIDEQQAA